MTTALELREVRFRGFTFPRKLEYVVDLSDFPSEVMAGSFGLRVTPTPYPKFQVGDKYTIECAFFRSGEATHEFSVSYDTEISENLPSRLED